MSRRLAIVLALLVSLPLIAIAAAVALIPGIELGPAVARQLEARLGRPVSIASLRVMPGRSVRIAIRDARIGNVDGGSAPTMVTLGGLYAEVDVLPLLRGRVVISGIDLDGLTLLLERTAERRANWHFGAPAAMPATDRQARASMPTILALRVSKSEVVFRTTRGTVLRTAVTTLHATAADATQPIVLDAEGSYNAAPITLRARLGSFAVLRDARAPFPIALDAASGDAVLGFRGTSRHPLDLDGLDGTLSLHASTLDTLFALLGAGEAPPVALALSGHATRQGDAWHLGDILGELAGAPFTGTSLALTEGVAGRPDAVAASLAFTHLDLDRLLGPSAGKGADTGPDLKLRVVLAPDPLVSADISAASFTYGRLQARDARLRGEIAPSRITLEELALFGLGAHLSGRVDVTPAGEGARLVAEARLHDSELDALRRSVGLGPLPVTGRIHGRLAITAEGTALNEALRGADGMLVLAMTGGHVAREVIEMASTDIRALFRTARGTTPITCMLAIVTLRDGAGEVAPFYLRAGTGAVTGIAAFDLKRQWLDLVIASRRDTTHTLALDLPVRISGRFADLAYEPAAAGPEERGRALGRRAVAALPPALREAAAGNACYRPSLAGG